MLSHTVSLFVRVVSLQSGSLLVCFSFSSSRQMAGLEVMVRCQGGVMAYRVECCIFEDIQPRSYSIVFASAELSSSCLYAVLSMCSLCQTCTLIPESLAFLLRLSGVNMQNVCAECVCLLTELGFVEKQPPEYDREQIGV